MLPSLTIALLLSFQTLVPVRLSNEKQVEELLTSFGYNISGQGPNMTLMRFNTSANLSVIQIQTPKLKGPIAALVLAHQYEFPQTVPTFKLLEASSNAAGWTMTSSLGGTLWLRAEIDLGHGLTNERLKNEMNGLLSQLDVLRLTLVEPLNGSDQPYGPPSQKPPPNPDTIVYFLGSADVAYVIDAWSWPCNKSYPANERNSWMAVGTVSGQDVIFSGLAEPGSRNLCPHLRLTARIYPPKGIDQQNWLKRPRSGYDDDITLGRSYPDEEPPYLLLAEEINLEDGISLRDLKRKIEDFAKAEQAVADSKG